MSQIEHNSTQCRWDWCTRNFNTNAEMRDHVLQDHIAHAQPVRRGDVPILRRAEGESVRLSWVEWSASALSSQGQMGASPPGKEKEKERKTYVEKAAMTADNNDDPSLLRMEVDIDGEGGPDPNHFPNVITSEAILFGPSGPKENHMTRPSQHTTMAPLNASPSRSRSRSHSPQIASQDPQSQTQSSFSPIAPLSFTALRAEVSLPPSLPPPSPGTAALVFRPRKAPPIHSPCPTPVKENMSQDVQDVFESQSTAGNNSQLGTSYNAITDSQWQPQSQLPLGSFDFSTVDPSQLQTDAFSGGSEVKPPASHSTLDVTELSDSSPAKWTSRNIDTSGSPSPQSSSQPPQVGNMPHSQGLGIGDGDNRATTPLQTREKGIRGRV